MESKVRVQFAKEWELRFLSHLDLVRTIERAVRRAALPVALSQGFNPQPRIAYASALAVGVSSDGEYLDIDLTHKVPASQVVSRLNSTLPRGLRVVEAVEVSPQAKSLTAQVNAACYLFRFSSVDDRRLQDSIGQLLQTAEVIVERETKNGRRQIDIRPLIYDLTTVAGDYQLKLLCATGSKGNLRPEEAVEQLDGATGLKAIHRQGLYVRDSAGKLQKPTELERLT